MSVKYETLTPYDYSGERMWIYFEIGGFSLMKNDEERVAMIKNISHLKTCGMETPFEIVEHGFNLKNSPSL